MGRFDFLYKMDLQHRAVAVYIYLADGRTVLASAGLLFLPLQGS